MKFQKKILDNGLTVLFEQRDVPVSTVMLAVRYGAAHESNKEKGMAHFMEHLCFKGTDKRNAKQIAEAVESVGGDLNAFTHEEITAYHVKLPSNHLDIAMDVIFDIFFNANFPEEEVVKEANVICEEIKMYKDNPRAHTLDKVKENLYEKPFGDFIGGSQENVRGMTREKLFNKHYEIYVPKNSILCVVGNNNLEDIISIVEKLIGAFEKDEVKEIILPEIVKKNSRTSEKRAGIEQMNLALGFHFPHSGGNSRYAAELFSMILGHGMSSKLFTEVREKRGLVYGVKTDLDLGGNYGYMIIWAGTDPEKEKEVIDICLKEFEKMKDITEEELKNAKLQVIGCRDVESEGSSETAVNLIMEEIRSNSEDYYEYEKKINSVTLEDIKELANISDYSSFSLGP